MNPSKLENNRDGGNGFLLIYLTFVSRAGSWLLLLCPMFMRSRAPTGLLVFVGRILNDVIIVIVVVCKNLIKPLFPLITYHI